MVGNTVRQPAVSVQIVYCKFFSAVNRYNGCFISKDLLCKSYILIV